MKAKQKISFTEGPLFWKLILFALPIMATGILQMLYNAADKIVVGQFSGDPTALGAIGSTTFISGLIINFMAGLGSGAGVVVSQLFGARRDDETSRAVHTSLLMALGIGLVMSAIAFPTAGPLLRLLGTKAEFMDSALLYLYIIYGGIIGTSLYNTASAILRAVGDSKTPLIIGSIAGIMNVVLNLVFVILCGMSVDGVALATIISQYFSAVAAIAMLARRKTECYAFSFAKLRLDKKLLRRIIRIGIPTGLQSTCFSITNMITTSAINTFPPAYVTAHSVAGNIDGMLDVIAGSFMQSSMTATGQNLGAMQPKRIRKVFYYSLIQAMSVMMIVAWTLRAFRAELASLFVDVSTPEYDTIISATVEWTGTMLSLYFLQGAMNAVLGSVRGLGYSLAPLILNIIGTCLTRAAWVYLVFPLDAFHTFSGLALLYPVSWTAAAVLLAILAIVAFNKLSKMERAQAEKANSDEQKEPVAQKET